MNREPHSIPIPVHDTTPTTPTQHQLHNHPRTDLDQPSLCGTRSLKPAPPFHHTDAHVYAANMKLTSLLTAIPLCAALASAIEINVDDKGTPTLLLPALLLPR